MRRLALFVATCGYLGLRADRAGHLRIGRRARVFYAACAQSAIGRLELAVILALFLRSASGAATCRTTCWENRSRSSSSSTRSSACSSRWPVAPVTALGAIVGFLVFRVLDVIKPWPSRRFEALPGGLGVMADDGMAGGVRQPASCAG